MCGVLDCDLCADGRFVDPRLHDGEMDVHRDLHLSVDRDGRKQMVFRAHRTAKKHNLEPGTPLSEMIVHVDLRLLRDVVDLVIAAWMIFW